MKDLHGIISILKPPGMTSHDVVQIARRIMPGKVGHTGTLDPAAAGVLVLTVGAATRLNEYIATEDKAYRAEFLLGLTTDTLDLEGQVVQRGDSRGVDAGQVRASLEKLTGPIEMLPPMYSAVKQDGRKLYELARQGRQVQRKPRHVTVYRFELLEFAPGPGARCLCEIECSKGTYIRSLAQMLGDDLRCGACLSFLLRTSQGGRGLADAITLEELSQLHNDDGLAAAVVPLADAVPQLEKLRVDDAARALLCQGNAVPAPPDARLGTTALVMHDAEALCLAEVRATDAGSILQPRKVFQR